MIVKLAIKVIGELAKPKMGLDNAYGMCYNGSRMKEELYIVRLYDGFDNEWIDVSDPVTRVKAEKILAEKTKNGTKNTGFDDIDYYSIFEADTIMLYSQENERGKD